MNTCKRVPADGFGLPGRLALGVAGAFLLVTLVPYTIVGKQWGMIWFLVALPFSRFTKEFLWDRGVPTYVLVTTFFAAAVWAMVTYGLSKLILRYFRGA